ncbi:MAG: phosphatidylglycerol---prolipoprotein diacylglyceryl transferase [Verrucomicrobiota bacterium]|jgi:phosphatidylglycerol:prolipoprotein diacylglycerol transferase
MEKVAFHLGSLSVPWFGLFVASAFLAGLWTASRRAARDGIAPERIYEAGTWLIIGTILGARALYVISYWKESFAGHPWTDVFKVWQGGLVFYGGLIGAGLACIAFVRLHRLPLWKFADALAPSIALGYFLGRFGCLMNGCCYGRPTTLPWAIHFPADHASGGAGVHPVQVYDSLLNLCFFLILARLHRVKKFDGQVFAAYLIGYSLLRSFVEMFRGDYPVHYLGGVATPAQLVSIAILILGLLLWWNLARVQPGRA